MGCYYCMGEGFESQHEVKFHNRGGSGYTCRPFRTFGVNLPESHLVELDARGLDCPMPLLKAKRALNGMSGGERLRVLATDKGSVRDFEVFSRQSGHPLISSDVQDGVFVHVIEKKRGEG